MPVTPACTGTLESVHHSERREVDGESQCLVGAPEAGGHCVWTAKPRRLVTTCTALLGGCGCLPPGSLLGLSAGPAMSPQDQTPPGAPLVPTAMMRSEAPARPSRTPASTLEPGILGKARLLAPSQLATSAAQGPRSASFGDW
ncbi:uncharacterized protein UV8b_07586 [Ustilaginoidea virens]|uniref:Uncharacterized protein n=1 Tax=Ustilaginoidea virens TaxID=1159556 RepID=A0A8E5HXB6_USTVR|nr:uncharacterized protein UV8b_07586 [Ustilaginoidea virens]QUC23345.1 hypothetical protein UV8b_07586 [Ustilaginoidea virens]